jgi:sulfur-oxidizing protein SoxY
MRRMTPMQGLLALSLFATPVPLMAETTWDWLRAEAFADRAIQAEAEAVTLIAPARTTNDLATKLGLAAELPMGDTIRRMTLIIDENPMPISAQIEMLRPVRKANFGFTMRMNGRSDVRGIVETADGRLLMRAADVKTSGVGACAAPPGVDAATALATLGEMTLTSEPETTPDGAPLLRLHVSHPSYSGLQMDQVTLLFTPMRYVETIEVWADDAALFRITGSISYSENPSFTFDRPLDAETLRVRLTDTDGAIFEKRFPIGAS